MEKCGLEKFVSDCWKDVLALVNNAAVYIDHAAVECLHWYTGDKAYVALKEAGAVSVHELAMYNFHYVKVKNTKKAVIISTSTDPAFYRRTIKMIVEKNTFESCIIVTSTYPNIMNYSEGTLPEDQIDYEKMKRDVKQWMSSKSLLQETSVEIIFIPIFLALLNEDLFVTPSFSNLMPPLGNNLTKELKTEVDHLVSLLHSLFAHLELKEDIYAMGNFSEYIVNHLYNLPAAAIRKNNLAGSVQNGVTLILVDRTLDLCMPTSNNAESLLARILCTLPHLPHHSNDVAVNMLPLLEEIQNPSRLIEIPGCLASEDKSMLNNLISKKQKEVLMTANQMLTNMLSKKSPKARAVTRITAHSLEKLVSKFRETNDLDSVPECSKKLQTILAITQALTSEKSAQLELLVSLEKLILQNLAVSGESSSVLAQLSNIVKTRTTRGLDTENLLALLIHVYALAGTTIRFPPQQETQLKESIADAVFEDIKSLNENTGICSTSVYHQTLLLLGVTDDDAAREASRKIADHVLNTLRVIAKQRAYLNNYTSLMTRANPQEMVRCVGILEQLVSDIVDPDKPHLSDLQSRPSSLLSVGFSFLWKGLAQEHPCDNSCIIIYVVGGVTPEESRKLKDIVEGSSTRVILGGSRLLNPLDVVDKVLLSSMN